MVQRLNHAADTKQPPNSQNVRDNDVSFTASYCHRQASDFQLTQSVFSANLKYKRSDHQQRLLQVFTEDVFIFSLLVYIAH